MDFLKENNGQYSSIRVIFFIGSLWAMAMTTYLAIKDTDVTGLIAFFTSVMGVIGALKVGQKSMEQKNKSDEKNIK